MLQVIQHNRIRRQLPSHLTLFLSLFLLSNNWFNPLAHGTETNVINFETSDYGLIFTDIEVNNEPVRTMIDFGYFHQLQLSTTLVGNQKLETVKTGYQSGDVFGNIWDVYKGMAATVKIGSNTEKNIEFVTQEGDLESVSQQIDTEFDAVLGWGFFKNYFTEVDYSNHTFTLHQELPSNREDVFSIPYEKNANQLIITARIGDEPVKIMIDTGSPVTVVDKAFRDAPDGSLFNFQLADQDIGLIAYQQDLSVLTDLEIVAVLGGDFLRQWRIIIDPTENKLHFRE